MRSFGKWGKTIQQAMDKLASIEKAMRERKTRALAMPIVSIDDLETGDPISVIFDNGNCVDYSFVSIRKVGDSYYMHAQSECLNVHLPTTMIAEIRRRELVGQTEVSQGLIGN